jgi:hypothetical protein
MEIKERQRRQSQRRMKESEQRETQMGMKETLKKERQRRIHPDEGEATRPPTKKRLDDETYACYRLMILIIVKKPYNIYESLRTRVLRGQDERQSTFVCPGQCSH